MPSSTESVAQRVKSPAAARASRSARRPRSTVAPAMEVTMFSPGGRMPRSSRSLPPRASPGSDDHARARYADRRRGTGSASSRARAASDVLERPARTAGRRPRSRPGAGGPRDRRAAPPARAGPRAPRACAIRSAYSSKDSPAPWASSDERGRLGRREAVGQQLVAARLGEVEDVVQVGERASVVGDRGGDALDVLDHRHAARRALAGVAVVRDAAGGRGVHGVSLSRTGSGPPVEAGGPGRGRGR